MTKTRVAIIGVGHLGAIHARLLAGQPGAELIAVVDPRQATRRQASDTFGVAAVASHHELLGEIDAAIVAAPTSHHFGITCDLLTAGVHALVEKPLAGNPAQANALAALARQHHRVLQVGHSERFNPAFQFARQALPEICHLQAERRGPYSFRSTDVGVVYDLMIHDVDLALRWINRPIVRVQAEGGVVLGPHEDWAQARLEFAGGCIATLSACRTSVTPTRTLSVRTPRGEAADLNLADGSAHLRRPTPAMTLRRPDWERISPTELRAWKERLFADVLRVEDLPAAHWNAIEREHADFLRAIRSGDEPQVTAEQAADAVAIAEQIREQILPGADGRRRAA